MAFAWHVSNCSSAFPHHDTPGAPALSVTNTHTINGRSSSSPVLILRDATAFVFACWKLTGAHCCQGDTFCLGLEERRMRCSFSALVRRPIEGCRQWGHTLLSHSALSHPTSMLNALSYAHRHTHTHTPWCFALCSSAVYMLQHLVFVYLLCFLLGSADVVLLSSSTSAFKTRIWMTKRYEMRTQAAIFRPRDVRLQLKAAAVCISYLQLPQLGLSCDEMRC